MSSRTPLPATIFEGLRRLDTCTASNAIERLNVRLRNEGFVSHDIRCLFPRFEPMLGYAVTGRLRTSSPPMAGFCYYDRMEWWRYLASVPRPSVMVLQDCDPHPGVGALVGEIHGSIARALHCIGCVTNGTIRDVGPLEAMGFHVFSAGAAVSHAYAHVVEFGQPVEIGGLKIHSGDLIHGDQNGVHAIPLEIAAEIPGMAMEIAQEEGELIRFCRSREFSLDRLAERFERFRVDGKHLTPSSKA